MKIEVAKAACSKEGSFGVMPEKPSRALAPGATISARLDRRVGGKLGFELVVGSFMPHEHDPEIGTDCVHETGCGTLSP